MNPHVAVIILNYRGWQDTINCVSSLKQLAYPDVQIVVVDNASADESITEIQTAYPDITIIESSENGGYSAGNNLGIRYALNRPDTEYIWLLNNDATVDSMALSTLVEKAKTYPNTLTGSLILYPDGRYQTVGNRVHKLFLRTRNYKSRELKDGQTVETLCGCSMLIPRKVFEAIGLLDETYFLYLEDTDFCIRANHAGFISRVALASKVFHKDGASTGKNKRWGTYYSQRNRLIFARKFASAFHFQLLLLYHLLYRRLRSWTKAFFSNRPDEWQYHRARMLAQTDFLKGVTGKCPHDV